VPSQPHYVVLHLGNGPLANSSEALDTIAQAGRFNLTDEIWIERLSLGLGTQIINTCDPRQDKVDPLRNAEHLYAFVRRVPVNEKVRYEGMQDLLAVIALSRVIQPTSTGLRHCAWVSSLTEENPATRAIIYKGICPDVMLAPNTRDWLTETDGAELRRLMPWLTNDMYTGVHRAYWNLEYALHVRELDMRWIYVVSGFEALLNTDREASTAQFKHRVFQLSDEFGVKLSKTELAKAYEIRSKLIHAEAFLHGLHSVVPQIKQNSLYQKLEDLLRMTVKRCLLDSAFGDHFVSNDTVNARWPMPAAPLTSPETRVREILVTIKPLAAEFYRLTGKPLGVTGEVAEYIAAELLGLTLVPARTVGYDALRGTERIQIKGRAYGLNAKPGQRMSRIKLDAPCDTVLLVLLDSATLEPHEIWEASYIKVAELLLRPGSKARDRGALGVPAFKSIGKRVWTKDVASR
jgi:hypothetical protein